MSSHSDVPPIRYPVYDIADVVVACSNIEAAIELAKWKHDMMPVPKNGRMAIHHMQGRMIATICTLCNCRIKDAAQVFGITTTTAHNRRRWWKVRCSQEVQSEYIQRVRQVLGEQT